MRVGKTSDEEANQIMGEGGRRSEIYSGLKFLSEHYGDLVRSRFPDIPRRVSGYNLNHLLPENGFHVARALVGSEGTCVTVLEATCRLVQSPPERVLLAIGYSDVYECADHVPEIMAHHPIGLEGFDDRVAHYNQLKGMNSAGLALLPDGGGWLLAEFGADTAGEAESQARGLMATLRKDRRPPNMRLMVDKSEAKRVWEVRESSLGVASNVPGEPMRWEGWEDSAVAPEKLGRYLREFNKLLKVHGYSPVFYGHFGHGCVHVRVDFDLQTAMGIQTYRKFVEEAADLVIFYGGSLSGEHGDGQSRGELTAEDVWFGTGAGFPRVQGALGSGLEDESRQGDRTLPSG